MQRLLHRRMTAKQQMLWSPRGAHLMLKVRTTVMNATFERDHVTAERWDKPPVSPRRVTTPSFETVSIE